MLSTDVLAAIDPDRLRRSVEAETCRRSLAEFVRRAWHVVEPGTPLIWGRHLDVICDHLQAVTHGSIKRLIINIAPGHCKSLLVSVFWPAWEWIDSPHIRSLYGSHDVRLAARDAVRTRDLVTSKWFRETFPLTWKLKKDQNAKGFFENDRHGYRWAFGMGGQVTGWRGDKVVVDDPMDAKHQFCAAVKDNIEFVWDNKLSSRVNNPQEARFVLVMQRLADDDLAGRLLKRTVPLVDAEGNPRISADGKPMVDEKGRPLTEPEYQHVCLPTEFDPERRTTTVIGWTDWRTEAGELLFPEYFNRQVVEQIKQTLGPDGYAGQHGQQPVASGGSKFQRVWFTGRLWRWDEIIPGAIRMVRDGVVAELILLATCTWFITADVAVALNASNDFTCYSIWVVTPAADIVLISRVLRRMTEVESIAEAVALKSQWKQVGCFIVEQNGVGLPLIQQLQSKNLAVLPVAVNSDKVVRALPAIAFANAGRIFIPDPADAPWVMHWLEEVTLFPAGGHDDQVDCLSLAAEHVFTGAIPIPGTGTKVETTPAAAILRPGSTRDSHGILHRSDSPGGRRR